jgi:hypothetical protein
MIPTGYHGNFFLEKAPAKALGSGFYRNFRPMLGSALHRPLFQ